MNKVLGALGAVALGAAAMYMLDPKSGKRRRAQMKDKAVSLARKEGDMISRAGRDLRNRAKGVGHKVAEAVDQASGDSGRLADTDK